MKFTPEQYAITDEAQKPYIDTEEKFRLMNHIKSR